jgi:hypothetical protein
MAGQMLTHYWKKGSVRGRVGWISGDFIGIFIAISAS